MNFPSLNTTKTGKVENRVRITWFCTRNIPTWVRVQFLSFLASTAEKCFSWILTTFSSLNTTGAVKVEKQAQMTRFCTRNIPTLFAFLSFFVSTAEKSFSRILATFSGLNIAGEGNVEKRTQMTRFCTRNMPTVFGIQFLLFPVSPAKKYNVRIWRHFQAWTNWAGSEQWKFRVGPEGLGLVPERYSHCLRCSSYRFQSVRLKNVLFKFFGLDDLVLHPKQTHTNWGAVLIVSVTMDEKCFSRILTTFSDTKTIGGGPEQAKL